MSWSEEEYPRHMPYFGNKKKKEEYVLKPVLLCDCGLTLRETLTNVPVAYELAYTKEKTVIFTNVPAYTCDRCGPNAGFPITTSTDTTIREVINHYIYQGKEVPRIIPYPLYIN